MWKCRCSYYFQSYQLQHSFFGGGQGGGGYGITMANYHSDYDRIASFPEMINCEEYNEYGNYNL